MQGSVYFLLGAIVKDPVMQQPPKYLVPTWATSLIFLVGSLLFLAGARASIADIASREQKPEHSAE